MVIFTLLGVGCEATRPPVDMPQIDGATMGTTYHIVLAGPPRQRTLKQLQTEIDAALETVNEQMSTYRPHSELSRFNKSTETDWFPVSPDTVTVVEKSLEISRLTDGAFDATVGPLVELWHFGPTSGTRDVPTNESVATVLERIGYQSIETRRSPPALRKTKANLAIDLSAIAKGFAVDKTAQLLESHGLKDFLVEIGGETRTKGRKADGTFWRIGIEAPTSNDRRVLRVVKLNDVSIATSGDYRNFFEHDGKRYSHTIDPRTGRPVEFELASVSVIADDCMTADAMATAIMVLGPDEGYNFADRQNLAVMLLVRQGDGWQELATPKFSAYNVKK